MCHCPIQCVVPPHILTALEQRGSRMLKNFAAETLRCTSKLRAKRHEVAPYQHVALQEPDGVKYRIIENAKQGEEVTGRVVREEGDPPSGDAAVDEAYEYCGDVYDFYYRVFARNSIDNKGGTLFSTVHFGKNFNNAFWNGERMVYGDGDGQIFKRFTSCVEVIGHELTHGITNASAELKYHGQSGALNESISDVFGCLVKQHSLKQRANQADWIIGRGLFMPTVKGIGVRSLAEPGTAFNDPVLGKDPCPATMDGYVNTKQDNGGVHINCTIPSHAFYLAAIQLGGYAWQTLGEVWYNTITQKIGRNTDFEGFAKATMQSCREINGKGTRITKALRKAWRQVKVL